MSIWQSPWRFHRFGNISIACYDVRDKWPCFFLRCSLTCPRLGEVLWSGRPPHAKARPSMTFSHRPTVNKEGHPAYFAPTRHLSLPFLSSRSRKPAFRRFVVGALVFSARMQIWPRKAFGRFSAPAPYWQADSSDRLLLHLPRHATTPLPIHWLFKPRCNRPAITCCTIIPRPLSNRLNSSFPA